MKRQFLQPGKPKSRMAVQGDLLARKPRNWPRQKRDSLFGWTVFLLLLIGGVFACWIGSFYIFQHPENARSYDFLRKLKKIDPPKRFEAIAAPKGRFYSADQLYKFYEKKTDGELTKINTDLIQAYIGNYSSKELEVPYVMGHFTVLTSQPLTKNDLMPSGYVALARSANEPRLHIELFYPAEGQYTADLQAMLAPGVDLKLERTYDLSVVLHVTKWADGRMQVTLVPLNYDSYGVGNGLMVHLSPPPALNLAGSLPVFGGQKFDDATVASENSDSNPAEKTTDKPVVVARTGPAPDLEVQQVARALPLSGAPVPIPKAAKGTSTEVATATPAEIPKAVAVIPEKPPTILKAIPVNSSKTVVASAAVPTAKPATTPSEKWKVYQPGKMPRGRLLKVPDLNDLAKTNGPSDTSYLQGSFVVKAVTGNRAVLRAGSGIFAGSSRIVVEYPEGRAIPSTGAKINRGSDRPFQITSVRKDRDGQLNVYVREITAP